MSDLSCDGGITIDDFAEVLDEALARRATAFKTDNGRSVLTAGTGLHAPKLSFPCAAHRLSWVLAVIS